MQIIQWVTQSMDDGRSATANIMQSKTRFIDLKFFEFWPATVGL